MKRGWKIAIISLVVVGAIAAVGTYLIFRRSAGAHMKYIPENALAVLTVNTKGLVRDLIIDEGRKLDSLPFLQRDTAARRVLKDFGQGKTRGLSRTSDIYLFAAQIGRAHV